MKFLLGFCLMGWWSASGNTYYVSPSGADSNNGSSASPWATIQKAASTASAGDTVLVNQGSYNERPKIRSNGIIFTTNGPSVKVLQGFDILAANITLRGFDVGWSNGVNGSAAIHIYNASSNIVMDTLYIHDTIIPNVFKTNGNWVGVGALMFDYIKLGTNGSQNCVLTNSVIDNCLSWNGTIQLMGQGHRIVNNIIRNIPGDLFHVFGNYHVISGNYITNEYCNGYIGGHVDPWQTYGNDGNDAHDILIERNTLVNCLDDAANFNGPGFGGSVSLGQLEGRDYSITSTTNVTINPGQCYNFEYAIWMTNNPSCWLTNWVSSSGPVSLYTNRGYFTGQGFGDGVAVANTTLASGAGFITNLSYYIYPAGVTNFQTVYFIGVSNVGVSPVTATVWVANSVENLSTNNNYGNWRSGITRALEPMVPANINNWTFRNNLFVNVGAQASIDIPGCKWYNNTFVSCTTNTSHVLNFGWSDKGQATGGEVVNNIFYRCGLIPGSHDMGWYQEDEPGFGFLTNLFDFNLVVGTGAGTVKNAGARSEFVWNEIHGANGIDPRFQSTNMANFYPTLGAWPIDRGTNLSGTGFSNDLVGAARPLGSGWDVGALEFDPTLLLHFDYAQSLTSKVSDVTGNGHDAVQMSATNWIYQTNVGGRYAGRFTLQSTNGNEGNGWGSYAAVTNLSGLNALTNGTVAVWAWYYDNSNAPSTFQMLLDGGFNGYPWAGQTWGLGQAFNATFDHLVTRWAQNQIDNGNTNRLYWPDNATFGIGSLTNWHHYAFTWSGNTIIMYYDGSSNSVGTIVGPGYLSITNDHNWLAVGTLNHNGTPQIDGTDPYPNAGWFNGLMGDTRIYGRTLSAGELRTLYLGSSAAIGVQATPSATNPPIIVSQPNSLTVAVGQSATFSVTVTGTPPLTYQWRLNGANIVGATGSTYTDNSVQSADAGNYSVVVANAAGSITSSSGILTVTTGQTTGAISSVTIEPNGWVAQVVIAGLGLGGAYDFGWGANNNPSTSSPKMVFSLVSPGFDDAGNPALVTRTVYGTKQLRLPYPNAATMDETLVGNSIRFRVALSEFIYAGDSNVVATIGTGLYSASGTANLGTVAIQASNTSTQSYSKVIGNWSWPNYERITGTTMVVRCVAFHRSAQQGRPVRAVKFWAADAHGHGVTNIVITPTVDTAMNDAVPVVEYVAALPTATLNQGDGITCNFAAYPWVGNLGSVLDTSDGVNVQPTPYYSSLSLLCDAQGSYGSSVAVVDPALGNDQTGQAVAAPLDPNAAPPAFATIRAAAAALANRNGTSYGRTDVGASTIYLRAGTHLWVGGNGTYGGKPKTWLTITRYPTDARTSVFIGGQSGNTDISGRIKLQDVTISSSVSTFSGVEALWFDQCTINSPAFDLVDNCTLWYATHCSVQRLDQGFEPFAAQTTGPVLIRGNQLAGFKGPILTYTAIGNSRTGNYYNGGNLFVSTGSSPGSPVVRNAICAFNTIYGFQTSDVNALSLFGGTQVLTTGAAIVQNLFENTTNGVAILAHCAADLSTGDPVNNVLVWHNTFVGQRWNGAYNDFGTNAYIRSGWSIKNNIFEQYNIKSDVFNGNNGPSGGRIGNWAVLYGVGASGNLDAETKGIGAAGSFPPEFPGLNCVLPTSTTTNGFIGFVAPRGFDGVSSGIGGGDYHLKAFSPATALSQDWILPYDLQGNLRGAGDASGVYSASQMASLPPTIAAQPQSVNTTVGGTATFSVTANGTGPLSYQWRFGGVNIPGATGTSYTDSNAQLADAGNYSVVVANSAGSVSSSIATLTVIAMGGSPSITVEPAGMTVVAGSRAIFSVSAIGTAPLSYQWLLNGASLPGATDSVYTRSSVQSDDTGTYSVRVSNSLGTTLSAGAVLAVSDPNLKLHLDFDEDFSGGGVLDMSANGNEGWQFNPTNWITPASGVFGSAAAQFTYVGTVVDASQQVFPLSQYIAVTNLNGFATLTNGTISLWAQFDTNNDREMCLLSAGLPPQNASNPIAASNSWSICRDSSSYLTLLTYPVGVYKTEVVRWPDDTIRPGGSTPILATTTFHLYTVTIDCPNNQAVAYYDGMPYMTNTINLPWIRIYGSSTIPWLCIGAASGDNTPQWGGSSYPHSGYMAGRLDDLRIYNRTLSKAEVSNLYLRPQRPLPPTDLRIVGP